jgi:hypothetical protein
MSCKSQVFCLIEVQKYFLFVESWGAFKFLTSFVSGVKTGLQARIAYKAFGCNAFPKEFLYFRKVFLPTAV